MYAVLSTVMPLLMVAVVILILRRGHPEAVPPGAWTAPAPLGLVRVSGEVLGGSPFSPQWRIRYPLPDGSFGELRAVATRPQVLRAGMHVPVLVDPLRPSQARLDVPAHAQIVSIVKGVWIAIGITAAVAGLCIGIAVLVLSRL
jgi:hypothetical protein